MVTLRKDNPCSAFYWKDYDNDESLRISSLAAQGLWMRLLCIAVKANPYGYLLVNGIDLETSGIARIAGVTDKEVKTLVDELERNGVFSRDRKGRIYCRRLVREKATSEKNQNNGKKGGNPNLCASSQKLKEKQGSVNPQINPSLKAPFPYPIPVVDSVAIATGVDASGPQADINFAKSIFDTGVKFLVANGTIPQSARSITGKWRKNHSDREILEAFAAAQREKVVEPVAWISARLAALRPLDLMAVMASINLDGTLNYG